MNDIKIFEYIGVTLAAIGFTFLSGGVYFIGFIVGFFSCIILIPYFQKNQQYGLAMLQCYFFCANIYGIYDTWGIL